MADPHGKILVNDVLVVDFDKKEMSNHKTRQNVQMQPKPYEVLSYLWINLDITLSSDKIYESVWGEDSFRRRESVADAIQKIKKNIKELCGNDVAKAFITNKKNFGYVIKKSSLSIKVINGSEAVDLQLHIFNKSLSDLDAAVNALPKPSINLDVPDTPDDEENYIKELYRAYADAEGIASMGPDNIDNFPDQDYSGDLADHRIEYFAAESIRRSLDELKKEAKSLDGQFDALVHDINSGIKPLLRRRYPDGYEKLQTVMYEVQTVPTDRYILNRTPHWISGEIKKGVCHFLVNKGEFGWVK